LNASKIGLLGWALTLVLPVAVFQLKGDNLSPSAAMMLSLMVGAAVQWSFRLVPDFVTGLTLLVLVTLLGLAPANVAFGGFISPVFMLVLGIFLLSALLMESSLLSRLSHGVLRLGRNKPRNSVYAIFITAVALTFAMPSPLGRSAVLTPMLTRLSHLKSSRFNTGLIFAMAQGCTLYSTVFLTGNPLNFVLLGFLDSQTSRKFQWLSWFYAASAFALVATVGMGLLLTWMLRNDHSPLAKADGEREGEGAASISPSRFSSFDWVVLALYGVMFAAIFTRHLHQIEVHWILLALGLVGFILLPMPTQEIRARIDWPTLLFVASIVSWKSMLDYVALGPLIAAKLPALLPYVQDSLAVNICLLAIVVGVVRLVVPGAPAFLILLATLLPLSATLGMSQWVMGFVLLTLCEGFVLPHQHGVLNHLLSEQQTNGVAIENWRLLAGNIAAWFLRVLAVIACIPLWQYLSLV